MFVFVYVYLLMLLATQAYVNVNDDVYFHHELSMIVSVIYNGPNAPRKLLFVYLFN